MAKSHEDSGDSSSTVHSPEFKDLPNDVQTVLEAYLKQVELEIIKEAKSLAGVGPGPSVRNITTAVNSYAPGFRITPDLGLRHRIIENIMAPITGVTLISAMLAIGFGLLAIWTDLPGMLDVLKIFAGAVVGSTGARVALQAGQR